MPDFWGLGVVGEVKVQRAAPEQRQRQTSSNSSLKQMLSDYHHRNFHREHAGSMEKAVSEEACSVEIVQ